MTTHMVEPEWDQATRDSALALGLYEDSLCPKCGRPMWVCQSETEFVADIPVRCQVATAQLVAIEGNDRPHADALMWPVVERPPTTDEEPADG